MKYNRSQEDGSEEGNNPISNIPNTGLHTSQSSLPPANLIPPPPLTPPPVLNLSRAAFTTSKEDQSTNENEGPDESEVSFNEPDLKKQDTVSKEDTTSKHLLEKQDTLSQLRTTRTQTKKWNILAPTSPRNEKLGMLRYDSRPRIERIQLKEKEKETPKTDSNITPSNNN